MKASLPKHSLLPALIVAAAVPAFAGVTVNSPYGGEQVGSPFTLSANASTCSSQNVSAMGFSVDNSSDTTIVNGTVTNTWVVASTGAHTLHVKAWGNRGASCVTDVAITVTSSGAIPGSNAVSVGAIQALSGWMDANDNASGGGAASGAMSLLNSPSRSGNARRFVSSSSNYGGERYYISFGDDTASANFLYDGWIYLPSPSNTIANLEFDMNQTMENGQTAIFGFQCDGWSGTWDYTKNAGTPANPQDVWVHSGAACNPRNWSTNTWHHVQVTYSRNDAGMVTYQSVWLDGVQSKINATVPSAFALGWGPCLLTNFQVDSYTSGSSTSTVYLDELTIYRW